MTALAGLREAGFSRPAYDQNPYPDVKVYDPYGDLADAGTPDLIGSHCTTRTSRSS